MQRLQVKQLNISNQESCIIKEVNVVQGLEEIVGSALSIVIRHEVEQSFEQEEKCLEQGMRDEMQGVNNEGELKYNSRRYFRQQTIWLRIREIFT